MERTELILIEAEMRWFFFLLLSAFSHLLFRSVSSLFDYIQWFCLLFIYAIDLFIHNETYIGYALQMIQETSQFHSFKRILMRTSTAGAFADSTFATMMEFYEFAESKEIMLTIDVKQMALRLANDAKWQHTRTQSILIHPKWRNKLISAIMLGWTLTFTFRCGQRIFFFSMKKSIDLITLSSSHKKSFWWSNIFSRFFYCSHWKLIGLTFHILRLDVIHAWANWEFLTKRLVHSKCCHRMSESASHSIEFPKQNSSK